MNRFVKTAAACYVPGEEWGNLWRGLKRAAEALIVIATRLFLLLIFPLSFPLLVWAAKEDEGRAVKARAEAVRKVMKGYSCE